MTFSFFDIFWVLLLLSSLQPPRQRRMMAFRHVQALQQFEQGRNSRVISLTHRQETISFLGIPRACYITIEDSKQVFRSLIELCCSLWFFSAEPESRLKELFGCFSSSLGKFISQIIFY